MENYKNYLKTKNNILSNTEYRILNLLNSKDLKNYKNLYFSKSKQDLINILLNLQKFKSNCKHRKKFQRYYNFNMYGGGKISPSLYPQPEKTPQEVENKFNEISSYLINNQKQIFEDVNDIENFGIPDINPIYNIKKETDLNKIKNNIETQFMELTIFSNNHGLNLNDYNNLIKDYIHNKTIYILNAKEKFQEQNKIKKNIENWINTYEILNDDIKKRNAYKNQLKILLDIINDWIKRGGENESFEKKEHFKQTIKKRYQFLSNEFLKEDLKKINKLVDEIEFSQQKSNINYSNIASSDYKNLLNRGDMYNSEKNIFNELIKENFDIDNEPEVTEYKCTYSDKMQDITKRINIRKEIYDINEFINKYIPDLNNKTSNYIYNLNIITLLKEFIKVNLILNDSTSINENIKLKEFNQILMDYEYNFKILLKKYINSTNIHDFGNIYNIKNNMFINNTVNNNKFFPLYIMVEESDIYYNLKNKDNIKINDGKNDNKDNILLLLKIIYGMLIHNGNNTFSDYINNINDVLYTKKYDKINELLNSINITLPINIDNNKLTIYNKIIDNDNIFSEIFYLEKNYFNSNVNSIDELRSQYKISIIEKLKEYIKFKMKEYTTDRESKINLQEKENDIKNYIIKNIFEPIKKNENNNSQLNSNLEKLEKDKKNINQCPSNYKCERDNRCYINNCIYDLIAKSGKLPILKEIILHNKKKLIPDMLELKKYSGQEIREILQKYYIYEYPEYMTTEEQHIISQINLEKDIDNKKKLFNLFDSLKNNRELNFMEKCYWLDGNVIIFLESIFKIKIVIINKFDYNYNSNYINLINKDNKQNFNNEIYTIDDERSIKLHNSTLYNNGIIEDNINAIREPINSKYGIKYSKGAIICHSKTNNKNLIYNFLYDVLNLINFNKDDKSINIYSLNEKYEQIFYDYNINNFITNQIIDFQNNNYGNLELSNTNIINIYKKLIQYDKIKNEIINIETELFNNELSNINIIKLYIPSQSVNNELFIKKLKNLIKNKNEQLDKILNLNFNKVIFMLYIDNENYQLLKYNNNFQINIDNLSNNIKELINNSCKNNNIFNIKDNQKKNKYNQKINIIKKIKDIIINNNQNNELKSLLFNLYDLDYYLLYYLLEILYIKYKNQYNNVTKIDNFIDILFVKHIYINYNCQLLKDFLYEYYKNIFDKLTTNEISIFDKYIITNEKFKADDIIIHNIFNLMIYMDTISIDNLNNISNFNLSVEDNYYLSFYNLKKKNIFYLYKLYMESYDKLKSQVGITDFISTIIELVNNPLYNNKIQNYKNYKNSDNTLLFKRLCNKNITDYNIIDYILYLQLYHIIDILNYIFDSLLDGELYEIIMNIRNDNIYKSPNDFKSLNSEEKNEIIIANQNFPSINVLINKIKVDNKKELTTLKTAINYFYNN